MATAERKPQPHGSGDAVLSPQHGRENGRRSLLAARRKAIRRHENARARLVDKAADLDAQIRRNEALKAQAEQIASDADRAVRTLRREVMELDREAREARDLFEYKMRALEPPELRDLLDWIDAEVERTRKGANPKDWQASEARLNRIKMARRAAAELRRQALDETDLAERIGQIRETISPST